MEHLISLDIVFLLKTYGYYVMVPLMFIEGPITTMISSTLASVGVFNIGFVFAASFLVDLASDIFLYYIGFKYGMNFVRKFGKYIGINEGLVKQIAHYLEKHGGKIIIIVKATTGLCQVTWVAAGTVKYNFKKFFLYTLFGGLLWTTFIVIMGHFYGYLWKEIVGYIQNAGLVVILLGAITIITISQFRKYQEKKVFKEG